jgi:hypothetical protein
MDGITDTAYRQIVKEIWRLYRGDIRGLYGDKEILEDKGIINNRVNDKLTYEII